MINPYWIEDPDVKKGEVDFLTTAEIQFWKDLIDTYLRPIDEDKEEQVSSFNGYLYETYRSALENFLAPSASAMCFVTVPRSNVLQIVIFKLIIQQERIKRDLKDLRDKMVFAFVMLNALFVLVIFLLQLNQDQLHFQWPFGQQIDISYDNDLNTVSHKLLLRPLHHV